jgi:hypothetical protein
MRLILNNASIKYWQQILLLYKSAFTPTLYRICWAFQIMVYNMTGFCQQQWWISMWLKFYRYDHKTIFCNIIVCDVTSFLFRIYSYADALCYIPEDRLRLLNKVTLKTKQTKLKSKCTDRICFGYTISILIYTFRQYWLCCLRTDRHDGIIGVLRNALETHLKLDT